MRALRAAPGRATPLLQGLVAPMTNAGQDGDASIGVGDEVYVSVTAYAVEVSDKLMYA